PGDVTVTVAPGTGASVLASATRPRICPSNSAAPRAMRTSTSDRHRAIARLPRILEVGRGLNCPDESTRCLEVAERSRVKLSPSFPLPKTSAPADSPTARAKADIPRSEVFLASSLEPDVQDSALRPTVC